MATKFTLVGDPPPPVADRPRCPWCDRPLRPRYCYHWHDYTKTFSGEYDSYGWFDTLRCGTYFANAEMERRRQKGEPV